MGGKEAGDKANTVLNALLIDAIDIETLAIPCAGSQDNTYKAMMDMVHAAMVLTNDVSLNPEF